MRVLLTIALCFFWARVSTAYDRLVINAKVNDQAVRLGFDTGAECSVLFGQVARRINLSWTDPPPNAKVAAGEVPMGVSEECRLTIGATATQFRFRIFDLPAYLARDIDGVLGWGDTMSNILRIDADAKKLSALQRLPRNIGLWTKWDLRDGVDILAIKLPNAAEQGGTICIDTGSHSGVELSAKRWKDWRHEHKEQQFTLEASYSPYGGLRVSEEFWADKLAFGQFSITNVPVSQSFSGIDLSVTNHQATLGLFALTRLDVIIDGENSALYTRPASNPKSKYQYNRIAAVFVPRNINSEQLVAHVVERGSAYEAGIRNGDVLVKIDDLDATNWRTDPKVLPLSRFWSRPAGTTLELSLLRDGKPFKAKVELREIFPQ